MLSFIIGVSVGLLSIIFTAILGKKNKPALYALVLSGIAFLYVGFTWTDFNQLVITIVQALVFVMLAYYGITRNIYILAAGYFLHGLWDLMFTYFTTVQLVPPHYDIFCLSVDFVVGAYIVIFKNRVVSVL